MSTLSQYTYSVHKPKTLCELCENQRADKCPKVATGRPELFDWLKYTITWHATGRRKLPGVMVTDCERFKEETK